MRGRRYNNLNLNFDVFPAFKIAYEIIVKIVEILRKQNFDILVLKLNIILFKDLLFLILQELENFFIKPEAPLTSLNQ